MKTISRIVALAVTATALVATATPAHAVGESTASTTTAHVGSGCINHPVNYAVALPPDAQSWFLQVQAYYPDGSEALSVIVGTIKGSPMTGTAPLQICGKVEPRGTWTLVPVLEGWTDAAGTTHYDHVTGASSTFEVTGQAKTSASLKAKTKGNTVKAKTKLVMKTDGNATPIASQPVAFQKKKGKGWKTFKTVTTSSTGVAKVKFKAKKKTVIRAKFAGAGEVVVGNGSLPIPAATSRTVRVG